MKQITSLKHLLVCLMLTLCMNAAYAAKGWQCHAVNKHHTIYTDQANSVKLAKQQAIKKCKKQSSAHSGCYTADSYCEQHEGPLDLKACVANDRSGKAFKADTCQQAMQQCYKWQFTGASRKSGCFVSHPKLSENTQEEDKTLTA